MLKQRLITAAILIPLVVLAVLFLPRLAFAIGSALILMLAAWEWSSLSGIKPLAGRWLYLGLLAILLLVTRSINPWWVLVAGSIWWLLIAPFCMALFFEFNSYCKASIGLFVLLACWQGLVAIRDQGSLYLLLVLVMVWAIDSAAYFTGKAWGRHKLAVKISPNKTLEGAIGGIAAALVFTLICLQGFYSQGYHWKSYYWIILPLILLTALASIIGDLFESMLKRLAGVKDSGRLVHGHGGVLDRIDSLIAAAPVFAAGMVFFS